MCTSAQIVSVKFVGNRKKFPVYYRNEILNTDIRNQILCMTAFDDINLVLHDQSHKWNGSGHMNWQIAGLRNEISIGQKQESSEKRVSKTTREGIKERKFQ